MSAWSACAHQLRGGDAPAAAQHERVLPQQRRELLRKGWRANDSDKVVST
jgi:hypothetical protein